MTSEPDKYDIEFFRDADGTEPVRRFIDSLSPHKRNALLRTTYDYMVYDIMACMGTRLDDYVQEVRERYTDAEKAQLDTEMRRFNLAGQLLTFRLDAGLTQKQVSERSGVSQADISRCERGLGNPTRATLDALVSSLGAHLEVVRNVPGREPASARG